jgi:hypothetical protein
MGWSGSAYYFSKLTQVFTNHLRHPPTPTPASTPDSARRPSKRFLRNARWRGTRLLPYMDDFIFLADSYHDAVLLRQRVMALLDSLGLQRNPKKGVWMPTQVGDHLGLIEDLQLGMFRATRKTSASRPTRFILTRPSGFERSMAAHTSTSGLRRKSSVSLPRHRARTFLFTRAPQRVSHTDWMGGTRAPHPPATSRPRVVAHVAHPTQRSVNRQAHRDRLPPRRFQPLRMGGRAERGLQLPSTRFWSATDRLQHITWKELRAVRHAVESFYCNSKAGKSSCTRTTQRWSPP